MSVGDVMFRLAFTGWQTFLKLVYGVFMTRKDVTGTRLECLLERGAEVSEND